MKLKQIVSMCLFEVAVPFSTALPPDVTTYGAMENGIWDGQLISLLGRTAFAPEEGHCGIIWDVIARFILLRTSLFEI